MPPKAAAKAPAKAGAKPVAKTGAAKTATSKTASSSAAKKPAAKAGAKTGAKTGAKKGTAKKAEPVDPAHEAAAIKIQARIRCYLGRKKYLQQQAKKVKMASEMEELRQQAWIAEVQYQRKQEEKARKKAEEERKRRKEENRIKKELLEAAFDGENEEIEKLVHQAEELKLREPLEAADGHGNTIISEAAAGGQPDTIKILLRAGADPNIRGEFGRTALWRACFMGQEAAVRPLLEGGADPRIGNDTGELPVQVANGAVIKGIVEEWDVAETDRLVSQLEDLRLERRERAAAEKQEELRQVEDELGSAKEDHDRNQKNFKKAHQELEKRITEYDFVVAEGKSEELQSVALGQIKEAEATLESEKKKHAASNERLQVAKLAKREKEREEEEQRGEEELPGIKVDLADLDDVLVRDVGNKIREDGRWPMVVDVSSQASVFLRYMDTNYVNALSVQNMEPSKLRRSLLGAIRYGKPCVVDLMDVDLWEEVDKALEAVQPGLCRMIMDRSILANENYMKLARKEDGDEYEANMFQAARMEKFSFILLTSNRTPAEGLYDRFYTVRVNVKK